MTIYYVDSAAGSNTSPYDTWAKAATTLATIAAIDGAGDTIYVASTHNESTASSVTWNFAGTLASPTKIICADKTSGAPPATIATGGACSTTGGSQININGCVYMYGLTLNVGDSTGFAHFQPNPSQTRQVYEDCVFYLRGDNSGTRLIIGDGNSGHFRALNCTLRFGNASQRISYAGGLAQFDMLTIHASSAAATILTEGSNTRGGIMQFSGCDLSPLATNLALAAGGGPNHNGAFIWRNCKLPASWSGTLCSSTPTQVGLQYILDNCDSGDTNYRKWTEDYSGSVKHETTIVRTGGATDGTTALAWKMATTANAEYPIQTLRSPEIVRWNETTGSAITVTAEIVHDSQGSGTSSAFTDKEIWLEVQYLGTSGFPRSTFIDDAAADVLASAADQTSSSETWTTTGLTTPVKQKLSVTFTPQEKGFIYAVVCMAGASDTCYVCPKLTIS